MKYAEDLLLRQRAIFRRVVMRETFHKETGHGALKGAIGYVTCVDSGLADVVFEHSSADCIKPDMFDQCGLTRIDLAYLDDQHV